MPPMATEIEPVSSETITTTASEFSLMPMPARWRMPRSRLRLTFFDSGSMHPAPRIRPRRMMTAPSCMGALTKKMFFSSSDETDASSVVPLRTMSLRRIFRSKTISTPVRDLDISVQAMTVWSMACSISETCCSGANTLSRRIFLLPICSRICRSSGWNRIISASTPTETMWLSR